MFFREKFGDVTDRIYTHDAALLPSIFQQAEAAGMAMTSKSPTRQGEQYHYRNSNLELAIITYVYTVHRSGPFCGRQVLFRRLIHKNAAFCGRQTVN